MLFGVIKEIQVSVFTQSTLRLKFPLAISCTWDTDEIMKMAEYEV